MALRSLLRDDRVRYLLVGGITSALYYALFAVAWLGLRGVAHYLVVTAAAHLTTALLVYPLYRSVVFRSDAPLVTGFLRFYTVFAGGLAASLVGLPLLIEVVGAPALVAQALIIAAVPVVSYFAHQLWTFRPRTAEESAGGEHPPTPRRPQPRRPPLRSTDERHDLGVDARGDP